MPAKIFPRRHCKNCNKLYEKNRPNKMFCSHDCKEEFRKFGSAYGPLKEHLTKLIAKHAAGEAAAQFAAYVAAKDFRRTLAAAGFIHRSMIKKRPAGMKPEALHAQILLLGSFSRRLLSRVTRLEARLGIVEASAGYAGEAQPPQPDSGAAPPGNPQLPAASPQLAPAVALAATLPPPTPVDHSAPAQRAESALPKTRRRLSKPKTD